MAAGHVIVVCLVALGTGALLNAQGILKTATGERLDSVRRDVALFFAEPLADLSHLLHTDRPRAVIQDAIGRGADDDISVVAGPSPTTTTTVPAVAGQPTTTTTVARAVVTPLSPLTLWAGGDSLGITPGESLINAAAANGSVTVPSGAVDGRVSTGLSRPDVFNWPAHVAEVTASQNPHAVVLTFGANDDQAVQSPDGATHSFGSDGWIAEYRRRVGGLMDQVLGEGRTVVWVGIAIVRDPARWERYALINQIYKDESTRRAGRVLFVDTASLFVDAGGQYADYLPDEAGQLVEVRAPDGIHFTRAGGNRIANQILRQLGSAFDFRPA